MSFWLAGLTGCKTEVKMHYKIGLSIGVINDSGVNFIETLSESSSTFEKNVGVASLPCRYKAFLTVMAYYGEDENGALAHTFNFKYGYECEIDGVDVSYTIKKGDEENGAVFRMTDFNLTSHHLLEEGLVNLEKSPGIHIIRYNIPALKEYGTDAVEYVVKLNFDEDTRVKTAKVTMQSDYVKYYSAEETQSYDFYVLEQVPVFNFVSSESSKPFGGDRNVAISYRKLNENTGKVFPLYVQTHLQSDEVLLWPNSKGMYMCRVVMSNHQEYQDIDYYCYILFIDKS